MKVLLVPDRREWALGTLAEQMREVLGDRYEFDILPATAEGFPRTFLRNHKKYDVVHFMANRAFFRWGWLTARPCVFLLNHVDGGWLQIDNNIGHADAICVSSEQWRKSLIARYKERGEEAHRIFFGVDTEGYKPSEFARDQERRGLGLASDVLMFGYAIDKSPRKRVDRLWECVRALKGEITVPFVVRLTGKNWKQDEIPGDLKDNIRLDGFLPIELMPQFYASLDYYLCTSENEGGPYPVMESMSCGITVLSTPVGVVPELIENGDNGFILTEDDIIRSFVDTVVGLSKNRAERVRIGKLARKTVIKRHSVRRAIRESRYHVVYADAMNKYRQRGFAECVKRRLFGAVYGKSKMLTRFVNYAAHR